MRARIVLVAALSFFILDTARADDFDDDFATKDSIQLAAPKQEPQALASEPSRASERHNTLLGPVGGVHVVDAASGQPGTFRTQIAAQLFRKNGFLLPRDQHRRVGGVLSLSATPIDHLELAAALTTYSNESTEDSREVFQVVGDMHLFAKTYYSILPILTVGGDAELALLNGVGGIGITGPGTSVGLRASVSSDLRKLAQPLPLLLRYGLRYYFDNSANIAESTENARYKSLGNASSRKDEYRHLLSDVERFSFQVNRVDMLSMSFGVEAPFELAGGWGLHPIAEWGMGIPVNRQDYDCLIPQSPADRDSCLKDAGFAAWPSTATFGLRVLPSFHPSLRGLSALLAFDVATSGHKRTVRELAPNAPYDLIFSLAYAYDTRTPKPVVIEKHVKVAAEPDRLAHILGEVIDRETALAVPRAIVHFEGKDLTDLATNEQGRFTSYPLDPGKQVLKISATQYETASCEATIVSGGADQTLRCVLVPLPKLGGVKGSVRSEAGLPIPGAIVRISGGTGNFPTTDAQGMFEKSDLPAGMYQAQIEAEGYLFKQVSFEVVRSQISTPQIVLTPIPSRPQAALSAKAIVIKRQVQFVTSSADIRPESNALMAEIADVLLRNPQVQHLEIQGHTDDVGNDGVNEELSQRRAEAVRTWLIAAGVAANRMTAVGYGSNRPLLPNITDANRSKNRRVAFQVIDPR